MKILITLFLISISLYAKEPIAIVSKVRGVVKFKDKSDKKYFTKLDLNSPIYFDSQIITKKKTFVKIVFLDDGSTMTIYPETELVINGLLDNRKILKDIEILHGVVKLDIANQFDNKFNIKGSNSNLNCRECEFWMQSDKFNGDKYMKVNGELNIFNQSINSQISLGLDSTILSIVDKEFDKYRTTISERKYLESLMLEFDEKNIKNKYKNSNNLVEETNINTVVIKFKNAANIEKEIILKYTN